MLLPAVRLGLGSMDCVHCATAQHPIIYRGLHLAGLQLKDINAPHVIHKLRLLMETCYSLFSKNFHSP